MGGYFVPRAAGHDRRIAAGVALALTPEMWPGAAYSQVKNQEWFTTAPTEDELALDTKARYAAMEAAPRWGIPAGPGAIPAWGEYLKLFSCVGLEDKITCPILNISTTGEGKGWYDNAKAFYDRLPKPQQPLRPHHRRRRRGDPLRARQLQPGAPAHLRLPGRGPGSAVSPAPDHGSPGPASLSASAIKGCLPCGAPGTRLADSASPARFDRAGDARHFVDRGPSSGAGAASAAEVRMLAAHATPVLSREP